MHSGLQTLISFAPFAEHRRGPLRVKEGLKG
jgi:hypothetical protein